MSSPTLTPCPRCQRHILNVESECPFCAASMTPRKPQGRLRRLGLGVAFVGLSQAAVACYGGPPRPQPPLPTQQQPSQLEALDWGHEATVDVTLLQQNQIGLATPIDLKAENALPTEFFTNIAGIAGMSVHLQLSEAAKTTRLTLEYTGSVGDLLTRTCKELDCRWRADKDEAQRPLLKVWSADVGSTGGQ